MEAAMLRSPLVALATAVILVGGSPASGQEPADARPPGAYAGICLQLGQAKGRFADYVDVGGGGGGYILFHPAPEFPLGLRVSAMYLAYGSETRSYQLVPGIVVDVTTRNQIFQLALGPQVTVGRGRVRAYGFGAIGGSSFFTTSGVEGSDQSGLPFASTTNHNDGTLSSEVRGGVMVRLGRARVPIFLDLGVRYLDNGRVTYVTKDRVSVVGNQLVVNPVDTEANLVIYHLGFTVGLMTPRSPYSN